MYMWCPWDDSKTPRGQPTSSLTTKAGRQATSVVNVFQALIVNTRTATTVVVLWLLAADGVEGVLFLVPLRG